MRKPGQRKANYDDESTAKLLKIAKCMIYLDSGGGAPDDVIRRKALALGIDMGPVTRRVVLGLIRDEIARIRKEVNAQIDLAIDQIEHGRREDLP